MMADIVDELENPEMYYPMNFTSPKKANAMLTALCQDAADEIRKLRKQNVAIPDEGKPAQAVDKKARA